MESNGKSVDLDGEPRRRADRPDRVGQPGTNGQHAYYQLIHQGTKLIPCDFIGFVQAANPIGDHHDLLMANLLRADRGARVRQDRRGGRGRGRPRPTLVPHRMFARQPPDEHDRSRRALTPRVLGELIALYEHKVFTQGTIWDINSFDQWGVELGKVLAHAHRRRARVAADEPELAPRLVDERADPPLSRFEVARLRTDTARVDPRCKLLDGLLLQPSEIRVEREGERAGILRRERSFVCLLGDAQTRPEHETEVVDRAEPREQLRLVESSASIVRSMTSMEVSLVARRSSCVMLA